MSYEAGTPLTAACDADREGIPKEYLEDHHEDHCSWGHSHIADRLANEPSSKLHRAYDQVAANL